MDKEKVGNFIKKLRKQANMTQKELGAKLHITDKAVSKWERGLSFPDITMLNSLAEIFNVTASEILNAEIGKKEEINVEKKIQETVEEITHAKEKREQRKQKAKKIIRITAIIFFSLSVILQLGYFIFKSHGYEYIIDNMYYIINEMILLSAMLIVVLCIKKNKVKDIITYNLFVFLTIINLAFMVRNGFQNKSILSVSKNFSNELVLKVETSTGKTTIYHQNKFYLFAKAKEEFPYETMGNIKYQWITNDVCSITYRDKDNKIREYVSTYGDRGSETSYYQVITALSGQWQVQNQYGSDTQFTVDSKGITIKSKGKTELFEQVGCKQFGTTALVLYHKEIPKYVIALNEDCKIEEKTGLIQKGGTVTLQEVSMEKTRGETLYCVTYKDEKNLENYKIVDMDANDYKIKNGILYISYDGENIVEVPGDFSNGDDSYTKYNYQISKEKTVFFYKSKGKQYLVYSNDMGKNWKTVEIGNNFTIQNIHFINSNIGFMLEFEDVAMGTAYGKIVKTTDGGKTWEDISYGIGEDGQKIFKRGSQIKFISEKTGFLTMPNASGDSCELYKTKDGGKNFSKVEILDSNIYDYYNLPTIENEKISILISQGSDGDYNGGDSKTYYSKDMGETWNLEESIGQ